MISETLLDKAVERGILTPDQLAQLRSLAQTDEPQSAEPEDDEKLRFVSGFSDIFVTLGIGLFAWAVIYFAGLSFGGWARGAAAMVAAWLLAEFFTLRRRMALPSIVLLCLFVAGTFAAASNLMVDFAGASPGLSSGLDYAGLSQTRPDIIAFAALITVAMAGLHYWRFRVPITIAAGAASLAGAAIGLLFTIAPDFARDYVKLIILIAGFAIFALAMRFDLSDPSRVTRRTDIAFWLHLLAAPLIVHPLIASFVTDGTGARTGVALAVLAIFAALGAIAVVIDRRAMLVSGLTYAGFAFVTLIQHAGLADQSIPITVLFLGAFVLLLSAGWRPLRAFLLRLLPTNLARRLPHPILTP